MFINYVYGGVSCLRFYTSDIALPAHARAGLHHTTGIIFHFLIKNLTNRLHNFCKQKQTTIINKPKNYT